MITVVSTCPFCRETHTYVVKEQSVAIQNSGLKRQIHPLDRSRSQPSIQPFIEVFAQCPRQRWPIKVVLNRADLVRLKVNPDNVSLALVSQPATGE
jgi:hypothetical protein